MSDTEPIVPLRSGDAGSPAGQTNKASLNPSAQVTFNRGELNTILNVYGTKVAAGEWRDYAIDFCADKAVFSIFRRTSEVPLYRVEKTPRLARRQGAYSVVAPGGMILRRGSDLAQVLKILMKKPKLLVV